MVNANQARPLVAFWLLAVAAGAITAIGLAEDDSGVPGVTRHPSRVTTSPAPEVVLGGVLRAQPNPRLTSALSTELWRPTTAVATAVPVVSPVPSTGTHKARGNATTTTVHQSSAGKTHVATQTTTTSTATSSSGHGKGHQKSGGSGKTTTTTTATATTTTHGGGRSSDQGKGH